MLRSRALSCPAAHVSSQWNGQSKTGGSPWGIEPVLVAVGTLRGPQPNNPRGLEGAATVRPLRFPRNYPGIGEWHGNATSAHASPAPAGGSRRVDGFTQVKQGPAY